MQQSTPIADLILQLKVPLFGALGPDDLAAIVPLIQRRSFAPDERVFSKGDRAEELFIILSGHMKISAVAPDGRELSFRTAGAGEIVGEIAVLDGGLRAANLTSLDHSETLTIGKISFARLMAERPTISQVLIQFLCHRLRTTSELLENVALHTH